MLWAFVSLRKKQIWEHLTLKQKQTFYLFLKSSQNSISQKKKKSHPASSKFHLYNIFSTLPVWNWTNNMILTCHACMYGHLKLAFLNAKKNMLLVHVILERKIKGKNSQFFKKRFIHLFIYLSTYLKGSYRGCWEKREGDLSSTGSLPKLPQEQGLGQDKARNIILLSQIGAGAQALRPSSTAM